MVRQIAFFSLLVLAAGLLTFFPIEKTQAAFHTAEERAYFKQWTTVMPPVDTNLIFPPSSACFGCHGFDSMGLASVDYLGNDVNVFDDWRTTMMANSAKDPFWRAKVSHEVLVNPDHQEEIETKCTTCHAPMGHYTEILRGAAHYGMDDLLADTIGLDGVSCGACHMISQENLGEQFSGLITFDTNRVLYGPYQIPFAPPMQQFVGYDPIYSPHINDAGICAGCHSLINTTLDLDGQPTGQTFVEQATYHEWLNSSYEVDDVSCQDCHMPQLEEPIVISSNYSFLTGRAPFGLHELVGANTAMLKLMRDNKEQLDIDAADAHFEETIQKTEQMLKVQSLDLELSLTQNLNDTAYFEVFLRNKAGHKFPSGYPSRRAFIEFLVVTDANDTLFHSGKLQSDWEVVGLDPEKEPHYDIIQSDDQVQIYEVVVGDVNGDFTTVLERGATYLKDNRLPPLGFTTAHSTYDTAVIAGAALQDPDFNREGGLEGSGTDRVRYHIPLNGYAGQVQVLAQVHYQSLPPRWMAPMLAEQTPEIDAFRAMFEEADLSTVIVQTAVLEDLFVEGVNALADRPIESGSFQLFPNPVQAGQFIHLKQVDTDLQVQAIRIWDTAGRLLHSQADLLPVRVEGAGVYVVEVRTPVGVWVEKVLVY